MHDVVMMKILNTRKNSSDGGASVQFSEFSFGKDSVEQFSSSGFFEDQVVFVLGFKPVQELDDVRLIQSLIIVEGWRRCRKGEGENRDQT